MNATATPTFPVDETRPAPQSAPTPPLFGDARIPSLVFTLLIVCVAPAGFAGINLSSARTITLPSVQVEATPQTVYSGDQTLTLSNPNETNGWVLNGGVDNGILLGSSSGETIPATILFKSVIWKKGGDGTAAGIAISQDGSRVEADPGFGLGNYEIVFEVRYDVPAYPRSDSYRGVSTFVIQ